MKKLDKEQMCVCNFEKSLLFFLNIFLLEKYSTNNPKENIFCNKTKLLWRIADTLHSLQTHIYVLRKTLQKRNFRKTSFDLGPTSLEGIAKLDTIHEQFTWQIFNTFFSDSIWHMNFEEIINFKPQMIKLNRKVIIS